MPVAWKEQTVVFVRGRVRVERTALGIAGGQNKVVEAVQDEASPTTLPGESPEAKNLDVNLRFSSKKRRSQKPQFYVQPTAVSAGSPPVVRRLFEVNSEPHTGARPSVRLCVGLISLN